jgi:hypothetical protein
MVVTRTAGSGRKPGIESGQGELPGGVGLRAFPICSASDADLLKAVICRSTGSGVVSSDRSLMTMR